MTQHVVVVNRFSTFVAFRSKPRSDARGATQPEARTFPSMIQIIGPKITFTYDVPSSPGIRSRMGGLERGKKMFVDIVPKIAGMIYAVVASLLMVLLLRTGRFNKRTGYVILLISAVFGFLAFAPMLPNQFQLLLLGNTKQLGGPVAIAVVILIVFVVMAFVFGRSFCGHVCSIGAL